MARQHRAVRIEVSELRGMIDSCRATQRTDGYRHMLAVLVGRLRERLLHHFEAEESRAPLAGLAVEHGALLEEGGRLALLLRSPTAPPDVVARTMRWLDALRRHEQGEDGSLAR
ncbi:hemerythrin domain-containing protein [bacterium]|nr:hemerythrin domain-containing protein [bacterium]